MPLRQDQTRRGGARVAPDWPKWRRHLATQSLRVVLSPLLRVDAAMMRAASVSGRPAEHHLSEPPRKGRRYFEVLALAAGRAIRAKCSCSPCPIAQGRDAPRRESRILTWPPEPLGQILRDQNLNTGEPVELLKALRFQTVGHDPLTGEPLNVIEQINQTFTILVTLRAVQRLTEFHPDAGPACVQTILCAR